MSYKIRHYKRNKWVAYTGVWGLGATIVKCFPGKPEAELWLKQKS